MLIATVTVLYTAQTSKAELGNHRGHLKVCSAHQSPKAELKCGLEVKRRHLCSARWIKNHSTILADTTSWKSHFKFHLWMVHRAKHWITQAHHRVINSTSIQTLICRIFGSACSMALHVAERESHFYIWAKNGQYLGIFQMGSSERAKFATIGYSTAYQQIVAAHNYYLVSGWGPWSQTAY